MKKVGIVVDDWKLPIFKRTLGSSGYQYTEHNGLTVGTSILKVETGDVAKLGSVVKQMNAEAARSKLH